MKFLSGCGYNLPSRASSAKFQSALAASNPHTLAQTNSRYLVSNRSAAIPATNTNQNGTAIS